MSDLAILNRQFEGLAVEETPAFVLNGRLPSKENIAWRIGNAAKRKAAGIKFSQMSLSEWVRTEYVPLAGGATNFTLTLDTTAPAAVTLSITGGAYITNRVATANISTSDGTTTGYQMKIWGAEIDNTANANIQTTQGASAWIAYSTTQSVTFTTGDGVKNLSVIVRDDVGNQSTTATTSTTLDTVAPVPNITVAASPTKVSKVATFDTSTFTFQSDTAIQAWKVKVVPAVGSLDSAGVTIPTTAGSTNTTGTSLAAVTNQSVSIKGTDLETASSGDGAKIVKVFVQDLAGNWSI